MDTISAVPMNLCGSVVDTAGYTDSSGPVLGPFQCGRKHMEALMSVEDSEQEQTIRTGEQGARVSGPRVLVAGASIAGPAMLAGCAGGGPR